MAKIKKGDMYVCNPDKGCGIEVQVKKICGCIDVCDLICCGMQMKKKTAKKKTIKKKKTSKKAKRSK